MIGTRLANYEITARLGAGGMGEVYQAVDAKLGRGVAIKVLPAAFVADAERLARFRREAQVLTSLNHSNIAQIYGLEDSGGAHRIVMELVDGETLQSVIRKGSIPIDDALASSGNFGPNYDVLPDGRFLMHRGPDASGARELILVQNWFEELKRLAKIK